MTLNSSLNKLFKILFICSFVVMTACQNTNTTGSGLTLKDPKPPTPPEVQQQSARLMDTYKSTLGLPAEGFSKVTEFSTSMTLISKAPCFYIIRETATLKQKEPIMLVEYKFQQRLDKEKESDKSCPSKMDRYVDFTTDLSFQDYANEKVALFLSYSDANSLLQANSRMRTAQVLAMNTTKVNDMDALFVRMKMTDLNNEAYLLETTFSTMNSFVDVIDQKFNSMKTNKQISYRKLIQD